MPEVNNHLECQVAAEHLLDQTLSQWSKEQYELAEPRLRRGLSDLLKIEKRQNLLAIAASFFAFLAALVLIYRGESIGYFIITMVIGAFVYQIYATRKKIVHYLEPHSDASLRALLSAEVKKQLKEYRFIGPWTFVLFSLLAASVTVRNGMSAPKTWFFLLTAASIGTYVLYRFVVTVPELKYELRLYADQVDE